MNEKELLKKAKTDESAIEELLKKYKNMVLKIARHYYIMGGDIDDLTQEGMIGLYRAIISYEEDREATFKTFAFTCIKRQILSAIKKANSKKNQFFLYLFDNDKLVFLDTPSNRENPEQNFISKENYSYINEFINKKLSKMEIQVLREYLSGESYSIIAKKLDIEKKSVDNALGRIRQKLSVVLDDNNINIWYNFKTIHIID